METLLVGVVVGHFGLHGELKVRCETEFPDRFVAGSELLLRGPAAPGEPQPVRLAGSRPHKMGFLIKLPGIDTPEAAAALRGAELLIPLSQRRPLPPDTYYLYELEGLDVYRQDDDEYLGRVVEIWQPGGVDVYVVAHPHTPRSRRWMIPAVPRFVHRIDVPAGKMWVTVEDGLQE